MNGRSTFLPPDRIALLLLVALILTAFVYWPGLSGLWLLDDHQNLKFLEESATSELRSPMARFIASGAAGPLGRPVSLLSFAIQHEDWPRNPWAFRFVNLLLHLLNGVLLFALIKQLGVATGLRNRAAAWCALITATLWLVHPLQVSTVLYIIQRMTELSALFTLAGLLAYVHGRRHIAAGKTHRGVAWMSAGIVAGGALAVLSKENGALLVLYAMVIEFALLRELPRPRAWHIWAVPFLYLPVLALAGYFLHVAQWITAQDGYLSIGSSFKDFTPAERLLTESRVLLDYLGKIFFPRPAELGLFHDDFIRSRGFLDPPLTLVAVFSIAGMLVTAFLAVKRAPVYAFGVLWFFSGHILEATIIPVELYFEHRNYLPLAGPVYAAIFYGKRLLELRAPRYSRQLMIAAPTCLLALLMVITWNEARLWGDPYLRALAWAKEKPNSKRAQAHSAFIMTLTGDYKKAAEIYKHIGQTDPADGEGLVLWLELGCFDPKLPLPDMKTIETRLRLGKNYNAALVALDAIITMRETHGCSRLKYEDLTLILNTLIANPNYASQLSSLHLLAGKLHATARMLNPAMQSLDKAYAYSGRVDILLLQAELLASAGLYHDAMRYIDKMRGETKRHPVKRYLYEAEINAWEQALQKLLATQ